MPTPDLRRGIRCLALLFLVLILPVANPVDAARFPYEEGERVELTGIVRDGAGEPLQDLTVVLEAARTGFRLRPFGRAPREIVRGQTETDSDGEFGLEWNWKRGFDRFSLIVGVPVREESGDSLHVLERMDVTRRVLQGSPVAVSPVVDDTTFLEKLRSFLADVDTEDEERIYSEMGRPDRMETVEYPDRRETSWWYFEEGKVFRFVDGSLMGSREFDPVEPL
ncbi:MAG: hypothetical protein R3234_09915 [Thermoanaerobaculia bacterium]|nr:hypothetical protein [Thermoanaerobaculia bacterium]